MLRGLDKQTAREELDAMDRKLQDRQKIDMAYAVNCARWIRRLEREESDMGRNRTTGY